METAQPDRHKQWRLCLLPDRRDLVRAGRYDSREKEAAFPILYTEYMYMCST